MESQDSEVEIITFQKAETFSAYRVQLGHARGAAAHVHLRDAVTPPDPVPNPLPIVLSTRTFKGNELPIRREMVVQR